MNEIHDSALRVRDLRTFVAIAELGSFSAAAARLDYTQSAVSHQIAHLERTVGVRLIDRPRGARRITLTAHGERLLGHARAILARLDMAQADMRAAAAEATAPLRVGTFQSVAVHVLPRVLQRYREARPDVAVELTETAGDDALLRALAHGALDLAFVMLPVADGPFEWRHLWTGEYVLLAAADSPLIGGGATLEDVSRVPLIAYRNVRRAHRVEEHLRALGLAPQVVFRTDDNGTLQRLVGVGVGAAFVPALAVEPNDPAVGVLGGLDGLPPFLVGMAWHAERALPAPAQAFLDTALAVCRTFAGPAV